MDLEARVALVQSVADEIVTEDELRELLRAKEHPVAYDGFEPSGSAHVAQGIMRATNVNRMTKAGFRFRMFVADWHAWANNKMGGDLDKIRTTGEYLIEIWRATGMDLSNVDFVWASEFVKDDTYWKTVMQIARETSLDRVLRTTQIMGRSEKDKLSAAQILYPCMQAADIFHLKADLTQLGMDQRKVNMLAREVGPKLGFWKPVVASHHMILGLGQPPPTGADPTERALAMKMSKSNPDSAIFMTDTQEQIRKKIQKAYCPPFDPMKKAAGEAQENPILEYFRYVILPRIESGVSLERKIGGALVVTTYEELEAAYAGGPDVLHPAALKEACARYLDLLIEPVRLHFRDNARARDLQQRVESFRITR